MNNESVEKLQAEVARLRDELQTYVENLDTQIFIIQQKDKEIAKLKKMLNIQDGDNGSKAETIENSNMQNTKQTVSSDETKQKLKHLEDENKQQSEVILSQIREIAQLKENIIQIKNSLEARQQIINELESANYKLQITANDLQQQCNQHAHSNEQLQIINAQNKQQLEIINNQYQQQITEYEEQTTENEQQIAELILQNEKYQQRLQELDQQLQNTQQDQQQQNNQIQQNINYQLENAHLQSTIAQLNTQIYNLNGQLNQLKSDLNQQQNTQKELHKSLDDLADLYTSLETQNQQFKQKSQKHKTQLKNAKLALENAVQQTQQYRKIVAQLNQLRESQLQQIGIYRKLNEKQFNDINELKTQFLLAKQQLQKANEQIKSQNEQNKSASSNGVKDNTHIDQKQRQNEQFKQLLLSQTNQTNQMVNTEIANFVQKQYKKK